MKQVRYKNQAVKLTARCIHGGKLSILQSFLKVPMKRNFLFFRTKEHKKLEDCRLPFLNILFGSGVTKL